MYTLFTVVANQVIVREASRPLVQQSTRLSGTRHLSTAEAVAKELLDELAEEWAGRAMMVGVFITDQSGPTVVNFDFVLNPGQEEDNEQ